MAECHDQGTLDLPPVALSEGLGIPRPALALAGLLGAVAIVSLAVVALVPFETAAFGGLTTPIVLTSGVLDDFNPGVLAVAVVAMAFGLLLSM